MHRSQPACLFVSHVLQIVGFIATDFDIGLLWAECGTHAVNENVNNSASLFHPATGVGKVVHVQQLLLVVRVRAERQRTASCHY